MLERVIGERVSLGSVSRTSASLLLGIVMAVVMVVALLPGAALAAPKERTRNYIITLAVSDAGEAMRLSSRSARARIRQRASETREATARLTSAHGIKARHRYTMAISGFSARLTPGEAARLRRDGQVAAVRPARPVRLAEQSVPVGIRRIKAVRDGGPWPDVDADIAIIDTGIGPVGGDELNIVGGVNCANDGLGAESWEDRYYGMHGTHVAGIAAARNNDRGVVGVAPGARLWSVRVFDEFGFGDESTVLCGLDWAMRQPIEVVNMSLEAPRGPGSEACAADDPDILHRAICSLEAVGITVVAAAGNVGTYSTERLASTVVPAAYDQVITVGAISDFDGAGWGDEPASAGCQPNMGGPDDSYASYSNYGSDVDIVAPGTCVLSTAPSADGTATQLMTGTSQAAPHVTGAVARYLSTHPGTPPSVIRSLVRASGRLDWDIRSDPLWSGVSDADEPNRVVDMAALEGPPELRVWLSIDKFRTDGTSTKRQARVDIQRGGGYSGNARLSLIGLRAKVGSASFDRPGASLDGLTGLGARLNLRLQEGSHDGRRELNVVAQGPAGSPAGSRPLELLVDSAGPKVKDLAARIVDGKASMAVNGAVKTSLQWTATDVLSRVETSTLQRRLGSQPWRVAKGAAGNTKVTLKPGQKATFRVRSTDSLGNSSLSARLPVVLSVQDSGAPGWRQPGDGWKTKPARSSFGGSLLTTTTPSASLVTEVRGSAVAVVSPMGPQRGTLRIRIDGGAWREASLANARGVQRRVIYSRRLDKGVHDLEIQGVGGQVAVDAVLILD